MLIGASGQTFNPRFLRVDWSDAETMAEHIPAPFAQEKVSRGWGGLAAGFYVPFMLWLETQLATELAKRDASMRCLIFEAFAHPYNWTDDNGAAASGLNDTIQRAIDQTASKYAGTPKARFLDPILITHSMGGLVGRYFAQSGSNAGKVRAVIHGAMPTQGAPAAYKRFMSGFEGYTSVVLGVTGSQVVAVGANSPGVLELLPSQYHEDRTGSKSWLRFSQEGRVFLSLPRSGDPYEEIYAQDKVWWRPVQREEVDPAATDPLRQETAWLGYMRNLQTTRGFHASLGTSGGFHPNTYMLYADSAQHTAWDHVEWRGSMPIITAVGAPERATVFSIPIPGVETRKTEKRDAPELWPIFRQTIASSSTFLGWDITPTDSSPLGVRFDLGSSVPEEAAGERREAYAYMQDKDAPGDGTVHGGSGIRVPRTVESERTDTLSGDPAGYAHDQCFNNADVRRQIESWVFDEIQAQL
jgi:hypothetical protein